jgi:signal transduction histidine kinase
MTKERAEDMAKREREPGPSRGPLGRLPFRRKINLLVILPTLAMVGLITPVTIHELDQAREWNSAADFLAKTKPISRLLGNLSLEREKAQLALRTQGGDPAAIKEYIAAIAQTDAQARVVERAFGSNPPPAVTAALADIDALSYVRTKTPYLSYDMKDLRTARTAFGETQNLVNLNYGTVVTDLVTSMGLAEKGAAGGSAANLETELAALYQGDLAENQREAALTAFAATEDGGAALLDYTTAQSNAQVALNELGYVQSFPSSAVPNQVLTQLLNDPAQRAFQDYQDQINKALLTQLGTEHTMKQSNDIGAALAALRTPAKRQQTTDDFVKLTDQRANAEARTTDLIVQLAQKNSSKAGYTAAGLLGACAATFFLLLFLSFVIRNSIVRPVMRLTDAATQVARAAAADLERVTDEDTGQNSPMPEFTPIPVLAGDEIGDLARAFNQVQETALLVLERQITIRRNTAEMFGNVGRRIHNLTGRQLSLIDQMERTETDPVLLDRMYRIDHLAVRLQRGADSLILLSGERETNLSGAPMRLTDVVRSAVGRVEGYQRAVLIAEDDAMVAPAAVSDLTLMIAELVENAVTFSPASSRVEIAVALTPRGFVVEIVDRGMGMTPDHLAAENARLVRRERLDLAPTRVLGLFVVGRLSVRTGAAVELAATPGGGTTARIFVPGFLLAGPSQDPLPQRTPQAEIAAAQPLAAEAPAPTNTPAPATTEGDLFGSPLGARPASSLSAPLTGPLGGRGGGGGRRRARRGSDGSDTRIPRQQGPDARSDTGWTDTAWSDTARTDTARSDTARSDTARTDTARTDTARTDTARTDTEGLPQRRPRDNGSAISPISSASLAPPPLPTSELPPVSLPAAMALSPVPQPGPPQFAPQQPPYGPSSGSQPPVSQPVSQAVSQEFAMPSAPWQPPAQETYSAPYPEPPQDPTTITSSFGAAVPSTPPGAAPSAVAPKPADAALPRRKRNTTPQPSWPPSGALTEAPSPPSQQDAVAVRDALEEYESGVERALRESAEDLPTRRRSGARHAGSPVPADGDDTVPNDTRRTTP